MIVTVFHKSRQCVGPSCTKLWEQGVRTLFNAYMITHDLSEDDAWINLQCELYKRISDVEAWELAVIKAVLCDKYSLNTFEARSLYQRYSDRTPLIDALQALLAVTPVY